MRTLILASVFLLTGLLWTGLPVVGHRALQAGEPVAHDRVAALAGRRAEVQALIVKLGKQLDALEKSMDAEERGEVDRRRARPSKRAKPKKTDEAEGKQAAEGKATDAETRDAEVPTPEAGDGEGPAEENAGAEDEEMDPAQAAILEIAGTYEVESEAFIQGMEDMIREQMAGEDIPDEFLESLIEQMRKGLEDFNLTFELDKDLTWVATSQSGGEEQTASGTWERDGNEVTLLQTHENGEESEETGTIVGTYDKEEDVLTLQASEDEGMLIPFAIVLQRVRNDE